MSEYIIRKAVHTDLKVIQTLSQEFIEQEAENVTQEYMTSLEWALTDAGYENYRKNIENDYLYVVCVDSEIIGYMTCWITKKQDWDKYKTVEIGNIFVKEEYRNRGIGTNLIEIAKKICKENHVKYLKVDVLSDNHSARKFYKKNGLNEYMITQFLNVDED